MWWNQQAKNLPPSKFYEPVSYTHLDVYKRQVLNVDLVYDYYGKMNKQKFYGYYTQDNRVRNVNKIENCYVKPRLIFDDGG